MKRLSTKQLGWIFTLLSSIFFILYLRPFVSISEPHKSVVFRFRDGNPETLALSQPDIAINYSFIYNRLIYGKPLFLEPISDFADDQIHPRSTTVIHNHITPIGFPGIIAFLSLLLKPLVIAFGNVSINFFIIGVTALAAAITPIFFFQVLAPFFRKRVAFIASLLLYAMPLWWYYGSWVVNQHVWLLFFIIQTLYWGLQASKGRIVGEWRYLFSALSGGSFALAVFIRPVEILWLFPALLAVFIIRRKRLWFKYHYVPFFAAAMVIFIWFAATQITFYGSLLGSGYVLPAADGSAGSLVANNIWASTLLKGLLPYGFYPLQILKNSWQYLIRLVFPWTILAGIGAGLIIANRDSRVWRRSTYYLYFYGAISIFLVFYYGSSVFFDSPIGKVPTIGTSYTRYFLPIYVFGLPFVARALVSLAKLIRQQYRSAAIATIMLLLFAHGYYVAHKGIDGLDMLSSNMQQFYDEREQVLKHTWPHAAIVTNSADKYLFPYRRTIVSFEDAPAIALYVTGRLAEQELPLYWYYHVPHEQFIESWQERLKKANLGLSEPIYSDYNMELRKIEFLEEIQ